MKRLYCSTSRSSYVTAQKSLRTDSPQLSHSSQWDGGQETSFPPPTLPLALMFGHSPQIRLKSHWETPSGQPTATNGNSESYEPAFLVGLMFSILHQRSIEESK